MPYSKQTWQDYNTAYPVSAVRMNHIEDGIEQAQATAESAEATAQVAQEIAARSPSIGMILALGG